MAKRKRRKTANSYRSAWRPLERGVAAGIGMYALGMGLNALRR